MLLIFPNDWMLQAFCHRGEKVTMLHLVSSFPLIYIHHTIQRLCRCVPYPLILGILIPQLQCQHIVHHGHSRDSPLLGFHVRASRPGMSPDTRGGCTCTLSYLARSSEHDLHHNALLKADCPNQISIAISLSR